MDKLSGRGQEVQGNKAANSNAQFHSIVEQAAIGLANMDDNFDESRARVGEMMLSMLVQDSIGKPQKIVIEGGALKDDETINLNESCCDDETGMEYLSNDVERTLMKVELDDVPQTRSFRQQQLMAFSEAFKSTTPEFQTLMMPHMIFLMDIPNKDEIIKAMRDIASKQSPDEVRKDAELTLKQALNEAQIKALQATTVKTGTEGQFAAMQAGQVITQNPDVAPIADVVMQNAGFQIPTPNGDDPNFPQPTAAPAPTANAMPTVHQNTSPQLPPVPQSPTSAMHGIETPRMTDNSPESTQQLADGGLVQPDLLGRFR
jgi:hypothetical protein